MVEARPTLGTWGKGSTNLASRRKFIAMIAKRGQPRDAIDPLKIWWALVDSNH